LDEVEPPEVVDDLEVLVSDVLPDVLVPDDFALVVEDLGSEVEVEPEVLLPLFDVVLEPKPVEADVPVEPMPELLWPMPELPWFEEPDEVPRPDEVPWLDDVPWLDELPDMLSDWLLL
jgi:hypothetical protein